MGRLQGSYSLTVESEHPNQRLRLPPPVGKVTINPLFRKCARLPVARDVTHEECLLGNSLLACR
jgi:hypothetical protein